MKTLISVIIPIFNMEKYLKKCIDSVIAQTFKGLEIILVDDGSKDASSAICDEYEKQDTRIRVIHKENAGLSEARNSGLDIATGEWISFIDSDDYIEVNMLENLIKEASKSNSDMAITGMVYETEDGKPIRTYHPVSQVLSGWDAITYFLETGGGKDYMCNKLFRNSLFQSIRFPKNRIYEDSFVSYQLMSLCKRIVFVSSLDYHYIQREQAITNDYNIGKQMDSLDAKMNKIHFIEKNRPELIPLAKQEAIQTCGWLLYKLFTVRIKKNDKYLYEKERIKILRIFHSLRRGTAYPVLTNRITVLLISISPKLYFYCCRFQRRIKHLEVS